MQQVLPTRPATRTRNVIYWVSTGILAFCLIPGGVAQLVHAPENVQGIVRLGYPVYFLTILGFWKILGGIAILAPRFALVKEWAYAGIAFDFSGAAVSNAASGMPVWHVVAPVVLLAITALSWSWRPASRTILADAQK